MADTTNDAAWDYLRAGAALLAPPGALALHCERCQAYQGHMTEGELLLGGVAVAPPLSMRCRRCGHRWEDRGPQRGR